MMVDVFEKMKEAQRRKDERRDAAIAFFGESRTNRPARMKATVARPACVYCGKPYGSRHTKHDVLRYAIGEPIQPYRGNHHMVCEQIMVGDQMGPYTGPHGSAVPGATVRRETWDGVSYYSGADPFCTNTCAINFAMAAYRAGYRMPRNPTE